MKCEHCGGHMEETDKRCPYCNSYNEHYKKPKPPAQPLPQQKTTNSNNKKPEEKGVGCFTVFAIIFLVILFFVVLKNCATSSTKKGYTDGVVEKYVEVINENLNFSDTNESGPFFQTSGKILALTN